MKHINYFTMKFLFNFLFVIIAAGVITSACRQGSQSTSDQLSDQLIEKEEIEENLKEVAYPLPEPFEVYDMLEDIGARYLGAVLNPVSNAENYFTQKSKAVNAGVYAADLGYAVTYDNMEDIKAYSVVLKSIVDDLGVAVDYSALQTEESRKNFSDKDSLVALVTDLFYNTYIFLYKESTPSLAGLMAAGTYAEGLYIATHISDDTYNNTDIVKIIHDQGKSLGNLINLLSNFKEDERVNSILEAFSKLKALYDDAGNSLTQEQLKSITSTIETIRESIIS
jgi:hypothetical protein